jgi:hypothetical protein
MANRPAIVSQADVARCIRACRKAGLPVARVVVGKDQVWIEVGDSGNITIVPVATGEEVVL